MRCYARVPYDNLVFASTAPFYAEIGKDTKTIQYEDVEYFMNWIENRIQTLMETYKDSPRKDYFLGPHREALSYFENLIALSCAAKK